MIKRLIYGTIILFLVLAILGFFFYQQKLPALDRQEPDIEISAIDLIAAFEADEQSANRKYLGRLLEVKGTVNLFNPGEGMIYLGELGATASVSCNMDRKGALTGLILQAGDSLTIKGICTGYLMDVQINRAVLVSH